MTSLNFQVRPTITPEQFVKAGFERVRGNPDVWTKSTKKWTFHSFGVQIIGYPVSEPGIAYAHDPRKEFSLETAARMK